MAKGIGFYGKDFFIIKSDKDLVAESIIRIIMTNFGERVGRPFFGVNLKDALFEQNDDVSTEKIKSDIIENIKDFEPRAKISTLEITTEEENENQINISIGFKMTGEEALGDERIINIKYKLE